MEINKLSQEELTYSLRIRSADTGTVDEMRATLRRCLRYESEGRSLVQKNYPFSFDEDKAAVLQKLIEIEDLIESFDGIPNSGVHRKITTKIAHVEGRIANMQGETDDECDSQSKFQIKLLTLDGKLSTKLKAARKSLPKVPLELSVQSLELSSGESSDEGEIQRSVAVSEVVSKSNAEKRTKPFTPIYKWGVTFSGSKEESVNAFLERVEDLRVARGASHSDLMKAGVDLFTGEALIWYRSNRQVFSTWSELCEGLKEEFCSHFYSEELYEEIKKRTQGKNESVGMYLAKMSNLFARLGSRIREESKVRILLRNLLPYYQAQLVRAEVRSVEHLKILCRQFEAVRTSMEAFVPPPPRNLCLEKDLAYFESTNMPSTSTTHNITKRFEATCHRCHKPGHFARNCTQKRCFKCNKIGYTVRTCPDCNRGKNQGNDSRGQ